MKPSFNRNGLPPHPLLRNALAPPIRAYPKNVLVLNFFQRYIKSS